MHPNRRDLLLAGACAASTALFWSVAGRLRAEGSNPPPETTTIRLAKSPSICWAPQYVVSDLLNAEGFTNVVYVDTSYLNPVAVWRKGDMGKISTSTWNSLVHFFVRSIGALALPFWPGFMSAASSYSPRRAYAASPI